MKCLNCGFEYRDSYAYCPNCGTATPRAETTNVEAVSLNPTADKVLSALKDKLFLAVCILMSASCVFSIIMDNFPLINILITIFLWLTFASTKSGYANENHLRFISGCVYANYVIINVLCGVMILMGALFGIAMEFVSEDPMFINELELEIAEYGLNIADLPQQLLAMSGWILAILFFVVAVITFTINILGMRKIHRFAKSVYQGIMYQNPNFENPRGAKNWLMFFGICVAVNAISILMVDGGFIALIATGTEAVAMILSSVLINKYFVQKVYYVEQNNIVR